MNAVILAGLIAVIAAAAFFSLRRFRRGGGCCGEHETVKGQRAKDTNPRRYPYRATLSIGGMTCANCARRVENALNSLEGTMAKVSLENEKARVYLKEPPGEEVLRRAVSEAGYVVLEVFGTGAKNRLNS